MPSGLNASESSDGVPLEQEREDTAVTATMPAIADPPALAARASSTTAHAAPTAKELRNRRFIVVAGAEAGKAFVPTSWQFVIGSEKAADLMLSDPAVSRFHCEITLAEQVIVRDLGSKNRTFVNGVPVLEAQLEPGAVLSLGATRLRYELLADGMVIPLSNRTRFGGLVGRSAAMRAVFASLEQAAASDATVLIEGDTGTGKEASAEAVHLASRRAKGPLVVVDCGALPPQLLESELFGHERGAFTGAVGQRKGAFETAEGGTIFLDEVGELTLELQPKLLRVLERREIKRVGSDTFRKVNVRVVAATNRNLRAEATARRFRTDLYYRLAVLVVRLPPLRDRREDLPLLVDHMLESMGVIKHPEAGRLRTDAFIAELARHAWHGNVRELRNYVERCLAMPAGDVPSPTTEPLAAEVPTASGDEIDIDVPLKVARESWVNRMERMYLERLMARHGQRVSVAARAAGVDRIHFYRLLWKHGLRARGVDDE